MKTYYSPTVKGFFNDEIHGKNMPVDAMFITDVVYKQLMADQAAGMEIVPAESGYPVSISRPAPSVEEIIAQKWEQIKAERDRRYYAGVKVGSNWFHTDQDSRIKYMALTMMGEGLPSGMQWKTMQNTFVPLTPSLVKEVFANCVGWDNHVFQAAETIYRQLKESANPAAYNVLAGWPKVYGEE